MLIHVWFLILLKLVSTIRYETGPECQNAPPCDPREDCNKCDLSNASLKINETGFPGRFRAQLLGYDRCRVQILHVFFYRHEYNASMCDTSVLGLPKEFLHSRQMYACDYKTEIQSSEKIHNIIHPEINLIHYVDMVYTGCYSLHFMIGFNNNHTTTLTEVVFIENEFTKEYFEHEINNIKFSTDIIGSSSPMTLKLPYRLSNEEFKIKISNMVDREITITNLCALQFIHKGSELICQMPDNTLPGEYLLTFVAYTGWCKGSIFDGKPCVQKFNFTIVEQQPNVGHLVPTESPHILIITLVCLVIASVVALMVTAYCHFRKKNILCERDKQFLQIFNSADGPENQDKDGLKGIVLVYARDCEPFMKAVAVLRKLLEERCGVKVYDIFDISLFNAEIASAPHDWAGSMLGCAGVKFVLLKTRCGELLYDPIIVNNDSNQLHLSEPLLPQHTRYRRPLYADTYVHTLFRMVKDDAILPGSYRKYFVVEIPNFSGDRQFVFVNPYRRYELPSTVRQLVSDLLDSPQSYEPSQSERVLEEAVQTLVRYVDENSDYMMDLLHKEP